VRQHKKTYKNLRKKTTKTVWDLVPHILVEKAVKEFRKLLKAYVAAGGC